MPAAIKSRNSYFSRQSRSTALPRVSTAAATNAPHTIVDSFKPGNFQNLFVALFGVAAGLTVIYYTSQFGTLYFLTGTARVAEAEALVERDWVRARSKRGAMVGEATA